MKDRFIKFRVYQGLTQSECLLISLIISLNESGNSICFSNEYATFALGTSLSSVKRDLKKLKTLGYITTTSSNQTRKIKLLQTPKFLDFPVEECEITEAQSEPAQNTRRLNMNQQVAQNEPAAGSIRATYKIEDKKDNKIVESRAVEADSYPPDFLSFVEDYGDTDPYFAKAYESWKGLTDLERTNALESIQAYTQSDLDGVGNRKAIHFYLHDKKWNQWRVKKHYKPKPKPVLTNQDIIRIFEKQNPDFLK